jgi:hypothetical protein
VKKKKKMSMEWLEFNEAKRAIESGEPIDVSKEALGGAMDRVRADVTKAVEIDVCDGADMSGGHLKVVVFFDGSHRGARAEFEAKMKEPKASDAQVEEEESEESKALKAQVVEDALRGVKGPKLVRFHLAVEGAREAVWVPTGSRLESALRWMVVEEMKKEREETKVPMDTEGPMETQEKKDTKVAMETMVPKKKKEETKAERAARLRAEARRAAEEAREAEEEAEEEAAAEREAERKETKQKLELAMEEARRAAETVAGLRRQLERQTELERRKRKRAREPADAEAGESGEAERSEEGESCESRRVSARKDEKEEIVMVDDREFKEAVGVYDGAVHHVKVERFEPSGPGGIGPVRGGVMVIESVFGGGAKVDELLARFAKRKGGTGGDVVVKGFTGVRQFDAWMEKNEFVKRTIDVDWRCKNPEGPMEPDWYKDTERVWVKRGSAELAALDKLIAKARAQSRKWRCSESPVSPRSPAYRPVYAYAPSPVDDDDDERNFVD